MNRITITLICLLTLITQLHAQEQIAIDTYAVFEQSCNICHGPNGAFRETLLIEHNTLIENGTVVPGKPNTSELYTRLLTNDIAKRMPLGQPQLSAQAIKTIRDWILAGAPNWEVTAPTNRQFISNSEILNTIQIHLNSLTPFDRTYARYFTLTHLYNAGEPPSILQEYHKGLNKLINSLSWGATIINPLPINPQETIFYIDLRHYEWDRNNAWTQLESIYPYHIGFNAPTQTKLKAQLSRLQSQMKCDIPAVHTDWFIATASTPPIYHDLLSLPLTDRELETRLEVDVASNIQNAPGIRVWRAGTNNSGVSNHNRAIERHTSRYGAYWKSYDFAGSIGKQNIFTHPLSFAHDGGEVIFNLPNGLQGYYITNANGFRLDSAPIQIVSNPAASDPTVRNGISCFGCHTEGMKTFKDGVRAVIANNTTPTFDKAQALRLYVEQAQLDTLLSEDINRYSTAIKATGSSPDDIEPIARFHGVFQGTIDANYAAAALGLETEALLDKIEENIGLQNIGLLALDGGSIKRDTWTTGFKDIIFALNFPDHFKVPTPIQTPTIPGQVVHIPDPNLHAAIAEELGKNPNAPITVEEMERLRDLGNNGRIIHDLTGLQFAINLKNLQMRRVRDNQISDLSPLAGLVQLRELRLDDNQLISDLSPLSRLINLEILTFDSPNISDLSPLSRLIKLRYLHFTDTNVSDFSPLAGLINLQSLGFNRTHNISDISPLAGLVNLVNIGSWGHNISDISPLARLTKLEVINFCGGNISDLTPLARLTGLKELYLTREEVSDITPITNLTGLTRLDLHNNPISDISPIAKLTQLKWLELRATNTSDISPLKQLTNLEWLKIPNNNISDVSPLANLTNLEWLDISQNNISDLSPLDNIRQNLNTFLWNANPAFPKGGPKIEGPWLWVVLPNTTESRVNDTDWLSEVSRGELTETAIATHGATEGKSVGDSVWTPHRLPPTGWNNIEDMLGSIIRDGTIYGSVSLHSPREQDTTMYVGGDRGVRVWLNGTMIYERLTEISDDNYTTFFPVTLKQGRNVLLVAIHTIGNGFFGFEPGTEYTVANPGIRYRLSTTPIFVGDTFTINIDAQNMFDLAGWQFDINFDPTALQIITINEGNLLKQNATTMFLSGSTNNTAGKITGLRSVRLSPQGTTGTGTMLQIECKAKSAGETELTLNNVQFATITGDTIPAGPHKTTITIEGELATGDVNRDGNVDTQDLILIAQQLGQSVPPNSPTDVNGDGIINTIDLLLVQQEIDAANAAPPHRHVDTAMIEAWIAKAQLEDDGSLAFKQGIENLKALLSTMKPESTKLLANYPNPFNPETWIPYQLAEPAEVTLKIYDINGKLIRQFNLGHQAAGMYHTQNRAVYWDGQNQLGENVTSGIYFYSLKAGNYTQTKRMVILK